MADDRTRQTRIAHEHYHNLWRCEDTQCCSDVCNKITHIYAESNQQIVPSILDRQNVQNSHLFKEKFRQSVSSIFLACEHTSKLMAECLTVIVNEELLHRSIIVGKVQHIDGVLWKKFPGNCVFLEEENSMYSIKTKLNEIVVDLLYDDCEIDERYVSENYAGRKFTNDSEVEAELNQDKDNQHKVLHRRIDSTNEPILPERKITDDNYEETDLKLLNRTEYDCEDLYETVEEETYDTSKAETRRSDSLNQGAEFLHLRSLSISDDHQSGVHIDSCCCYSHGENDATIDDLVFKINTLPPKDAAEFIKYIHSKVIPKACEDRDIHSLVKLLQCRNYGIETRLLEEICVILLEAPVNTHPHDTLFESMKILYKVLEERIADAENIIPIALSLMSTLYQQSLHSEDIAAKLKRSAKEFGGIIKLFKDLQQCNDIEQDLVDTLDTMLQDIDKMAAKPSCLKVASWRKVLLDERRLQKLAKELPKKMTFLEKYSCLLIVMTQLYARLNSVPLRFLLRCVELLVERFTTKPKYTYLLYPTVHLVVLGTVKILEKHESEECLEEEKLNEINKQLCSILDLFMANKKINRERRSKLLDTVQKVMFHNNVCISSTIVSHMEEICGKSSLVSRTLFHTQYLLSPLSFLPQSLNTPPVSSAPRWHTFYGDILNNTNVTLQILLPSKQCLLSGGTINYKDKADKEQTRSHENTVEILRHLCQRSIHPNIIRLLAYQLRPIPFMYAIEKLKYPSLRTYIRSKRSKQDWLPIKSLVPMAADMVNAVSFVHQEGVIHRNLTCSSFSIKGDLTVVLGDFSLSQLVDGDSGSNSRSFVSDVLGNKIPTRWSAPESLLEDRYDALSDTWMFGQLLYELFTHGCHPYTELYGNTIEDIMEWVVFHDLKPHRWPCIPAPIHQIILRCVESTPNKRISLSGILSGLEKFMASETFKRSRTSSIKKIDSRKLLYPELETKQRDIELGIPVTIRGLKSQPGDKRISYYNLRKSRRGPPEKLAISESDLASPDTPTYRAKKYDIEVEEPVTTRFMEETFPAFREDVRSCLLVVSQWPPERQQRESSQHDLNQILRYRCRNGMSLLEIALTKKYGDPDSSPKYLETIGAAILFVRRMHSKNWILRDICCSTLFRSYVGDQAVFMPRIGRFLYVNESNSTDGCIVDKRCLKLFQNRRNWLPLEVLRSGQFSKDSDMYMLGMTIYEFFKATDVGRDNPMSSRLEAVPFAKVSKEKLLEELTSGELLDEPDNCPYWLWQEVLKCLDRDHTKRPSAAKLMEVFNKQCDFDVERAAYNDMSIGNTLDSTDGSKLQLRGPPLPSPRKSKKQNDQKEMPNAPRIFVDHQYKNVKSMDPDSMSILSEVSFGNDKDDEYLSRTSSKTSLSSALSFGNTSISSGFSFGNSSESRYGSGRSPAPSRQLSTISQSTNEDYDYAYERPVQTRTARMNTFSNSSESCYGSGASLAPSRQLPEVVQSTKDDYDYAYETPFLTRTASKNSVSKKGDFDEYLDVTEIQGSKGSIVNKASTKFDEYMNVTEIQGSKGSIVNKASTKGSTSEEVAGNEYLDITDDQESKEAVSVKMDKTYNEESEIDSTPIYQDFEESGGFDINRSKKSSSKKKNKGKPGTIVNSIYAEQDLKIGIIPGGSSIGTTGRTSSRPNKDSQKANNGHDDKPGKERQPVFV